MRQSQRELLGKLGIPDIYVGTNKRKFANIADKLRHMEIGDKITVPYGQWGTVGATARSVGIKVATRSLGSKTLITVWRIE